MFTILPTLLFIAAFAKYAFETARGGGQPQFGSWLVWGVISWTNAIACLCVMDSFTNCIVPLVDAGLVGIFFAVLCFRASDYRLSKMEKALVAMAAASGLVIVVAPVFGTLFVQIPLLLAVWPTLQSASKGGEDTTVWGLWTVALVINFALTTGTWENWVYPTAMLALHGSVFFASAYAQLSDARKSAKVVFAT